jgi:hypothetical protein
MNSPNIFSAEIEKNPSVAGTAILGGVTRNQRIPPWEVPYCLNRSFVHPLKVLTEAPDSLTVHSKWIILPLKDDRSPETWNGSSGIKSGS